MGWGHDGLPHALSRTIDRTICGRGVPNVAPPNQALPGQLIGQESPLTLGGLAGGQTPSGARMSSRAPLGISEPLSGSSAFHNHGVP